MAEATTVQQAIENMKGRFRAESAKGMNATYQFDLTGDGGGKHYMQIADGNLNIGEGQAEKSNITVTMSANDFIAMTNGKLNPQMAFMSGKLRIAGDMSLALKMQSIFPMS